MKKYYISKLLFFASFLIIYSCEKAETTQNSKANQISTLSLKVNNWLDAQKTQNQNQINDNIDLLKANLDYSTAQFEKLDQNHTLAIIHVKDGLREKKMSTKKLKLI